MTRKIRFLLTAMLITWLTTTSFIPQTGEPWSAKQLMEPGKLAAILKSDTAKKPLIVSIGPEALIPGSIDVGPVSNDMKRFRQLLSEKDKDTEMIIYCGCCPFKHCPNIRPAITYLKEHGFTSYKLLNLPNNIKVDWIDHGYPVQSDN